MSFNMNFVTVYRLLIALCVYACAQDRVLAARMPEQMWDESVAPILDRNCFKCHAGVRQKSGLDLRSLDTILRGGERGPAIIPGKPDESRIIQFILPGADPHMPNEGKQLPDDEEETLRQWIRTLPRSK